MSSPPVNIPHNADSGSRRSALTSAFEELAVVADQKTDEGEAFSAHVSVDRSLNPSVVIGGGGRELRGPSFRSRSSRAQDPRDPPPGASDLESASFGRQHGSFSAISFLQQSHESDGDLSCGRSEEEDGSPGDSAPFEFNGGRSGFTSAEPNEMSYLWNSLDGGDGNAASDTASEEDDGASLEPEKEKPHVSGSFGAITGMPINPPRVVVVHVGNDDDEGCAASAGRKQRGSFSSLLLLEAHELSTLDSSPNSQRRGAMQAHIEDEFVTRGLEKGAPVASTRVAA